MCRVYQRFSLNKYSKNFNLTVCFCYFYDRSLTGVDFINGMYNQNLFLNCKFLWRKYEICWPQKKRKAF